MNTDHSYFNSHTAYKNEIIEDLLEAISVVKQLNIVLSFQERVSSAVYSPSVPYFWSESEFIFIIYFGLIRAGILYSISLMPFRTLPINLLPLT